MTPQTKQALEMAIEALQSDNDCECGQSRFHVGKLTESLETLIEIVEELQSEAKEKPTNTTFWEWLPKAYRDGDKGEGLIFSKYNMEVAYHAGIESVKLKQSEASEQEPVAFEVVIDDIGRVYIKEVDDVDAYAHILGSSFNGKYKNAEENAKRIVNLLNAHPTEFKTLTDDEIYKCQHPEYPDTMYFARAIEQAIAKKNGFNLGETNE